MHLKDRQRIIEDLYQRMHNKVNGLCRRYVYDFHEREEVVQEIFLNCFKAIGRFEHRAAIETWLYKVSVSACLKHNKKKSCLKRKGFHVELTDWNGPSTRPIQLDSLLNSEVKDELDFVCYRALKEDMINVQCFLMAHRDGLSYREISKKLGINPQGVAVRAHRGRLELRRRLRKTWLYNKFTALSNTGNSLVSRAGK